MAEQELKFYARQGLVTVSSIEGQQSQYLGREMVKVDGVPTWPATKDPATMKFGSPLAQKCMKLMRRQRYWERALWAADEFTATQCGLPFIPTKFQDGEHVAACEIEIKQGEEFPKASAVGTSSSGSSASSGSSSARKKGND